MIPNMKKKLILVVTLILIITSISGCLEDKSSTDNALSGLKYSNTQYGFGLNPPEDWTTDEADQYGSVRFYGPQIDNFTMNLGVSFPGTLAEGDTLSSLVQEMKDNYPSAFTNYSFISSNARTINGMSAYDIVYTFTYDTSDLKGQQVLIEKNGKVIYTTFTASIDTYDDYISIIEESLSSFTIV